MRIPGICSQVKRSISSELTDPTRAPLGVESLHTGLTLGDRKTALTPASHHIKPKQQISPLPRHTPVQTLYDIPS